MLDNSRFIRTHKKHIINKAFIEKIIDGAKSSEIKLVSGHRVEISRRRLKAVKDNI